MKQNGGPTPRTMQTTILTLVLVFLTISTQVPAQEFGRIAYLEGDVELVRDGEILTAQEIFMGDPVLELDVIQTGDSGYVELDLTRPAGTVVRVLENSAYYAEVEPGKSGGEHTRLKLLNGTLEIAVQRVERNSYLDVETRTAVFGVRGTQFDVLTAPDESVLLGVQEGQVVVLTSSEQRLAGAGKVVESVPNQQLREETVSNGDFERYYRQWTELRENVFRSGAAVFVAAYAQRYLESRGTFQERYRRLIPFRQRLSDAVQGGGSLGSDMRLKQEIGPAIISMRSILPIFEHTVYRLRELRRYHNEGIGRTSIDGVSSDAFFRDFGAEERELIAQLAEVRTIFRLYNEVEQRSFGGLPGGGSPFGGNGSDLLDSMRF